MTGLIDQIKCGKVIISDGGMGTMLQRYGMPSGMCPEMMNIERPEVVRSITAEYINAGARLVETNTFGANSFILKKYGFDGRLGEINAAGVRLAKEGVAEAAASGKVYVFASMGPSGVFLEPLGETSESELAEAVKRQVAAFKDAGVDGVCVETMSDLTEARLTVDAVKAAGLVCMALMCFVPSPKGYYTMMGVDVKQSVTVLLDAGADVIGAGCGVGSADMIKIAKKFRSFTGHPLIMHPNAGNPEYRDGRVTYPETPESFAAAAKELAGIGVNIIGGCCGTTPEHIAAVASILSQ